jgi:hypothetical protein
MRRLAALIGALSLAGCGTARVEVLPVVDASNYDVSCCVFYMQVPPSTTASAKVQFAKGSGFSLKLGAKWRF